MLKFFLSAVELLLLVFAFCSKSVMVQILFYICCTPLINVANGVLKKNCIVCIMSVAFVHFVGFAQSNKVSFASTIWKRVQSSGWLW